MTSICNYSHPELQITAGLERHGAGTLFPYNPEFYELESGLYGPGSIWTWHLLLASVVVHWFARPTNSTDGHTRPGLSTDLLAAVAYPVFAATDLVIQAARLIGTDHGALAIFCLRNPMSPLKTLASPDAFSHTQLNLTAGIPPDVLSLGQHVIGITGPLAVCYEFCAVASLIAAPLAVEVVDMVPARPASAAQCYLLGGFAYVLLALVVFHLSLGDLWITLSIFGFEVIMLLIKVTAIGTTLCSGLGFLRGIYCLGVSLVNRNRSSAIDAARVVGACIIIAPYFPGWVIYDIIEFQIPMVPDLAITVDERDQLAALIAGAMALGYTIYTTIRKGGETRRPLTDVEMGETQGLNPGQEQPPDEPRALGEDQRASTF